MRIPADFGSELSLSRHEHPADTPPEDRQAPKASLPVLVVPAGDRRAYGTGHGVRPRATLIAQLVAATEGMPAARPRRRSDPALGAECYRAIGGLVRTAVPSKLRDL